MPDLDALAAARAIAEPIHEIGGSIYLSMEVHARAAEEGYDNPFAFYFAGRGGTLGDVHADVVVAALGWFHPNVVRPLFAAGCAVHGAAGAAERMMRTTATWGEDHLAGVEPAVLERFVALAEQLVDGAEISGLPLFAGFRAQERTDGLPGRSAQLIQILREWRGAHHLVATTAVGMTPLEAILSNEGAGQAALFGWPEPYPEIGELAALHDEAEAMTDRLDAAQLEHLLSPAERGELVDAVTAIAAVATAG